MNARTPNRPVLASTPGSAQRRSIGLRVLRSIPLVLLVAWAVGGYGLPGVPNLPGFPGFEENTAEASHRTVTPSNADPIYPPNHTIDGEVQDLGSLPNADFEDAPGTVGTPATNSGLQTSPSSVVTVPNGTFASGTFANWVTSGTTTIQTSGPTGDWARLDSSSASITSDAITVPSNAQELVYDINYVSTTATSGVEVFVLSGVGYGTSTKIATDTCNSCGAWSTSFQDITAYRGESIKLRFRRPAGTNQVGLDNIDVQEVFPGFETTGSPARKVDSGDAYAELRGKLTTSAFTVDAATQFFTVDVKKISTTASWEIEVAEGPSYTTFTSLGSGSAGASWDLVRVDATDYRGDQVKLRVRAMTNTIAVDDIGLMRVEVPDWPDVDETTRLLDDSGNQYVKYHGSITSGEIEIPAGTENLVLRARDDDATFAVQATVSVLTGAGYTTVNQTDTVDLTTSWDTYRFGVGMWSGQTVKIRISTGSGTMNVDDAAPFESVLRGWTMVTADAIQVGEDDDGTYLYAADGKGFQVRSGWISTAIAGTSATSRRFYTLGFMVGTCMACLYKAWWTDDSSQTTQIESQSTNKGVYRETQIWVSNDMGDRGYFTVGAVNGGRLYSIADNVARQHLAEPFSRDVGLGIDTSTGAMHYAVTDVSLPGPIPITFARYYNAHSDDRGPLGYRWSHSFETKVMFQDDDRGVVFGSGKEEFFTENLGTYSAVDPRIESEFVENGNGTYRLTTKDNLIYRFDTAGVLTSIEDLNGNDLVMGYDGSDRLISITGDGGTALTLSYDGQDRLETVTDPMTAEWTYGYDASDDLITVTDPEGGITDITYAERLLDTITDGADDLVIDNDYDPLGRVTTQTDAEEESISLTYDTPGVGATQVERPAGGEATFYFDRFARTTDVTDPTDRIESYVYDVDGNLDKVIDPADAEWDFGFDSTGNLTSVEDPLNNPMSITWNAEHLPTLVTDGRGNDTTFTYDGDGNLLTTTDQLSHVTTNTYDGAGNLLTTTNPENRTTTFTYDGAGNQLTKTDPRGKTWTYTYDDSNRKITETDPLSNTTTYDYDLLGRLTSITDPLGNETELRFDFPGNLKEHTNPLDEHTFWDYDDRGLVVEKTDADGKLTTYGYDANRNMTSVTDPNDNETVYAYDDADRLISVTDPLGNETTYSYDDAGRLASTTDPLERVTAYTYDDNGRIETTTLPNEATFGYTYDENGNLTSTLDELGNETTFVYDDANRLTSTTDPLDNTTSYVYDDAGLLLSETDPLSETTTYAYDAAGNRTSVTDPLSNETVYAYDDAGQLSSITDPTALVTEYGYDDAGGLVSVNAPGNLETVFAYDDDGRMTSTTTPEGGITSYTYGPTDLLLTATNPLGAITTHTYDDGGRRTTTTDDLGRVTTFGYDDADRMVSLTDDLGGVVEFGFDDAGQMTSMTDPREETWTYAYNELGQRVSVTDPLDRTTSYTYDDAGQRVSRTDAEEVETTYAYDDAGQLTTVGHPGGSIGYTYDDAGRRASMTDATGTTTWTRDDAGQVTSLAAPAGTLGYTYDEAGRRASMTLPGSRSISYTYGSAGRLASITDWNAETTSFTYDDDGNRTGIERANGVDTTTTYDDAGQVDQITHANSSTTLQSYDYAYDDVGNRTSVTTGAGTESYTYDDLNRLTQVSYPGGPNVSYTYDAAGNRTSQTRGMTTTNYTYDEAGQILTAGAKTFDHDDNGAITRAGTDTFTYDFQGRTTGANVGLHSATYAYDGDGVKTSSTVDSDTDPLLVDREAGLPTVVDDGEKAYLHAGGLQSQIAGSSAEYALADGLGSIRGISGSGGTLSGSASWEAFGEPAGFGGATSIFGFAGEPSDATGLVDLRARMLDPLVGRFLTADTVSPNAPGTQGFSLYTYVANNPATWTDPSGHVALAAAVLLAFLAFIALWLYYTLGPGPTGGDQTPSDPGGLGDADEGVPAPVVPPEPGEDDEDGAGVGGAEGGGTNPCVGTIDRSIVGLDANVIIDAIERGLEDFVAHSMLGRRPVISPQAYQEYLAGPDATQDLINEWMRKHGATLGSDPTQDCLDELDARAARAGRPFDSDGKDLRVAGSAMKDGAPMLTRDWSFSRVLAFLKWPFQHYRFP